MKLAPFTMFGKTVNCPVYLYLNSKEVDGNSWDEVLWVERNEDWYALTSMKLKNKVVRVVERKDFIFYSEWDII